MAFLILELSVILFICSLLPLLPWRSLVTDLPSHFMLQYVIGGVVLMIGAALFKAHWSVYPMAVTGLLIGLWHIWPYLPLGTAAQAKGDTVKILQANMVFPLQKTERLAALITKENPDIILIDEANMSVSAFLKSLSDQYPHQHALPSDAFGNGLAIASRLPLQNLKVMNFAHPSIPAHHAKFTLAGKSIDLLSIHPANPLRAFKLRDQELEAIAAWVEKEKPQYLVMAGDMNITPYAPSYTDLIKKTGLANARAGRGLMASWPHFLPGFMGIPIDHVLHSKNIAIQEFRLGDETGSDHIPTVTVLGLAP